MLWQAAYSELVEMDVLWPDFTRSDLDAAIRFHSYGLVGMLVETLPSAIDADALAGQLCRLLTGEIWGGARPD